MNKNREGLGMRLLLYIHHCQQPLQTNALRLLNLHMIYPSPVQCPKSFRAMQMGLVGTQAQIAANVGVK